MTNLVLNQVNQNALSDTLVFPYLHKVGNVGRSGIFVFHFKLYFPVLIVTYQFF